MSQAPTGHHAWFAQSHRLHSLCCTARLSDHFYHWQLVLLQPFHLLLPAPQPAFHQVTIRLSLDLWVCLFCSFVLLFLDAYISEMWFSLWLISLSIISPRSIHVVTNGTFHPLWPCNTPLYICTASLSIHPLVDTEAVSMSWLLWIMLPRTPGCIHIFTLVFLFSSNAYPEVELLGHVIVLFLILEEPPYCFPQQLHQFTIASTVHETPSPLFSGLLW